MTEETTKRGLHALDDLPRTAQDLDREDAAIHREGISDQKPGVKRVRAPTKQGAPAKKRDRRA